MITYSIQRFIHSIIRENKLYHTMEALLKKDHETDILLHDLIEQVKIFLQKENDELFDENKLKYLIFLDSLRENVWEASDLKAKNNIEKNSILFRLYELPKKRNNLFSFLLVYFYIRNKNILWWKEIFQIIHLYLMIIAYRNRLSRETRIWLSTMDSIQYEEIESQINRKFHSIKRRFPIFFGKRFLSALSLSVIAGFSIGMVHFFENTSIKTSVFESENFSTISKVALDSLFLGRITDGIFSSLSTIWMQNIISLAVIALLIQAVRNNLTNVLFNNLLTKGMEFFSRIAKILFRSIFSLYNFAIYKVETRYIFSFIEFLNSKRIHPNTLVLSVFLVWYFMIYTTIIAVYAWIVLFFIPLWEMWMILVCILTLSFLLSYINLMTDISNFRSFLLELEAIFSEIWKESLKEKMSISE